MFTLTKKILVGWDGSPQSRNALKYAIDEAKEKDVQKVTAVFVKEKENLRIRQMLDDYEIRISEKVLKKKEEFTEALMEEARSLGRERDVQIETRIIKQMQGPGADIVKFAEENEYHHIIVGSHGRSGISRIALGSVAEEIIRKAKCVVTVVRCGWPLDAQNRA